MTTTVDIANRALIAAGIPKRINSLSQDSVEAQAANSIITITKDDLLRKAPWNCATNYANLTYITSVPGTPENPTLTNTSWHKGIPAPNWAYEYQYPYDCLRPLWIVPQTATGFSGGIPITTALTGGAVNFWGGPPVKFKVAIDQFYVIDGNVTIVSPGTGYQQYEILTLPGTPAGSAPIGAPGQFIVNSVGGGGAITSIGVVPVVAGATAPYYTGSYFNIQNGTNVSQASSTGSGVGATFNFIFNTAKLDQRIILTNQENASLAYIRNIGNPDVMDPMFVDAWTAVLGARISFSLSGERSVANSLLEIANRMIMEARQADANEGLTINDVTPDWIRQRGIQYPAWEFSPNGQFDWGPLFTPY